MSPGLGQFKDGPEQRAPVPPLEVLTSALSRSFGCKRQDKVLEEVLQGHVASDHGWLSTLSGLGRSGGNEPDFEAIGGCVHERRALTPGYLLALLRELSQCPRALTEITKPKQVRKMNLTHFFVPVQKKGWKIDPHVSNLRSREFLFQGVQVHP